MKQLNKSEFIFYKGAEAKLYAFVNYEMRSIEISEQAFTQKERSVKIMQPGEFSPQGVFRNPIQSFNHGMDYVDLLKEIMEFGNELFPLDVKPGKRIE